MEIIITLRIAITRLDGDAMDAKEHIKEYVVGVDITHGQYAQLKSTHVVGPACDGARQIQHGNAINLLRGGISRTRIR